MFGMDTVRNIPILLQSYPLAYSVLVAKMPFAVPDAFENMIVTVYQIW